MRRKRVVFVINSLGDGGAERVLGNLLTHAEARLSEVKLDLVLLDAGPERRSMPPYVEKHALNCRGAMGASVIGLARTLHALRPDVVVSFLVRANVAAITAARLFGIPCVISERMHLSRHLNGKYRGLALAAARALPWLAYRFADRIIAVSEGVREDLVQSFAARPAATRRIYNPYDLARIEADGHATAPMTLPDSFIVSAGRLVPSKNFAQLIEAYLASSLKDALVILGEGPERGRLEAIVRGAGAADRILLPGYLENPFAVMSRARFFVSASLNEGFPNALAEAMALGAPVVATDCPSGPAEILADMVKADLSALMQAPYGILVPEGDVGELTRAMQLMSAPDTRAHYAARAKARLADFAVEKIAAEYWDVIESAAARR
jgi:glycosyltransferase involved in cell wall biosynthesis